MIDVELYTAYPDTHVAWESISAGGFTILQHLKKCHILPFFQNNLAGLILQVIRISFMALRAPNSKKKKNGQILARNIFSLVPV